MRRNASSATLLPRRPDWYRDARAPRGPPRTAMKKMVSPTRTQKARNRMAVTAARTLSREGAGHLRRLPGAVRRSPPPAGREAHDGRRHGPEVTGLLGVLGLRRVLGQTAAALLLVEHREVLDLGERAVGH